MGRRSHRGHACGTTIDIMQEDDTVQGSRGRGDEELSLPTREWQPATRRRRCAANKRVEKCVSVALGWQVPKFAKPLQTIISYFAKLLRLATSFGKLLEMLLASDKHLGC